MFLLYVSIYVPQEMFLFLTGFGSTVLVTVPEDPGVREGFVGEVEERVLSRHPERSLGSSEPSPVQMGVTVSTSFTTLFVSLRTVFHSDGF